MESLVKEVEWELRLLKATVDGAVVPAYWVDCNANYMYANRAATTVLGYSRRELQTMNVGDVDLDFRPELWRQYWERLAQGDAIVISSRYQARSGNVFPVSISLEHVRLDGEEYACARVRDIGDELRARRALAQSEQLYRSLVESIQDGIFIIKDGLFVYVNEAFARVLGRPEAEIIGRPFLELVAPDDRALVAARYEARQRGEEVDPRYEIKALYGDGSSTRLIRIHGGITSYLGGIATIGTVKDITRERRAEEELRLSEVRYRTLFHTALVGLFRTRASDGEVLEINASAAQIAGYSSPMEMISERAVVTKFYPKIDRERLLERLAREGEVTDFESRLTARDGRSTEVSIAARLYPEMGYIEGVILDVTERKRAERALKLRERYLSGLSEIGRLLLQGTEPITVVEDVLQVLGDVSGAARACLYELDQQGELNAVWVRTRSWVRQGTTTAPPARLDLGAAGFERWMECLPGGTPAEVRSDRGSEAERAFVAGCGCNSIVALPLMVSGYWLGFVLISIDEQGREWQDVEIELLAVAVAQLAAAMERFALLQEVRTYAEALERRVDERTSALAALTDRYRDANRKLQAVLNGIPDMAWMKDRDGRFLAANATLVRASGRAHDELIGSSDVDLWAPDLASRYRRDDLRVIETAQPLRVEEPFEGSAAGTRCWIETIKVPIIDDEGAVTATVGIARDVSERRQMEESLRRANLELESANRELEAFVRSVSHDLRAPLRTIRGFSEALLEDCGDRLGATGRAHVSRVQRAAETMDGSLEALLALSRIARTELVRTEVDVSAMAAEVAGELSESEPSREVDVIIEPGLTCEADPRLLRVVLENLLANAWKFTRTAAEPRIEVSGEAVGQEMVFRVLDNGRGFDMRLADRLFVAFRRLHSDEEVEGSGLGLATVLRIVRRHGGRAWGEGEPGRGATFTFTLPRSSRYAVETMPPPTGIGERSRG